MEGCISVIVVLNRFYNTSVCFPNITFMTSITWAFAIINYVPTRQNYFLRTSMKNVLTSPYGPICNTKVRIFSVTSLGHTLDVNLTIIHKMVFY